MECTAIHPVAPVPAAAATAGAAGFGEVLARQQPDAPAGDASGATQGSQAPPAIAPEAPAAPAEAKALASGTRTGDPVQEAAASQPVEPPAHVPTEVGPAPTDPGPAPAEPALDLAAPLAPEEEAPLLDEDALMAAALASGIEPTRPGAGHAQALTGDALPAEPPKPADPAAVAAQPLPAALVAVVAPAASAGTPPASATVPAVGAPAAPGRAAAPTEAAEAPPSHDILTETPAASPAALPPVALARLQPEMAGGATLAEPTAAPAPDMPTPPPPFEAPRPVLLEAASPVALPAGTAPAPAMPPARQVAPIAIALAFTPGAEAGFTLALEPAEMGRVEIQLRRDGEGHVLHITAERPETLGLLQRDRGELSSSLAQAGVAVDSSGVTFSLEGEAGGGAGQRGGQPAPRRQQVAANDAPPPTWRHGLLDLNI